MAGQFIWACKIGGIEGETAPDDGPMQQAIKEAYQRITGKAPRFVFSGWDGQLTPEERNVVDWNSDAS